MEKRFFEGFRTKLTEVNSVIFFRIKVLNFLDISKAFIIKDLKE